MPKFTVSLGVQVTIYAPNATIAERIAFAQKETLKKEGVVTFAQVLREEP